MKMKRVQISALLTNPFFLFSSIWLIVTCVYMLNWSELYPKLTIGLLSFLIGTSFISLFLSILTQKKGVFSKSNYQYNDNQKSIINRFLLFFYIMFSLELLKFGGIPLLMFGAGLDISRTDFGLPIISVIRVNGLNLLLTFCSISFFSCNRNHKKNIYLLYIVLCMLPSLLIVSRSALVFNFLSISLAYIQNSQNHLKNLIKLVVYSILAMFFFGVLGNIRDKKSGEDMIIYIGEASDEFLSSGVPHEFFWGYLYISSPLANLQNTINTKKIFDVDASDYQFMLELLPESFAKRSKVVDVSRYQVNDALNTGTVYWGAYLTKKWTGMFILYIFLVVIILFSSIVVKKGSLWKDSLNLTLCVLVVACLFTNAIKSLIIIPQVYFIVFYELFVKKTRFRQSKDNVLKCNPKFQ